MCRSCNNQYIYCNYHLHDQHGSDITDGDDSGSPFITTKSLSNTYDASYVGLSEDSKEIRTIRKLRLSGQLQTIGVSEGQLGESNCLLEARTKQMSLKQISLLKGRWRQLQLSVDNTAEGLIRLVGAHPIGVSQLVLVLSTAQHNLCWSSQQPWSKFALSLPMGYDQIENASNHKHKHLDLITQQLQQLTRS